MELKHKPAPKEASMYQKLHDQLIATAGLYAGDGELVRKGAEAHGVRVIPGNMITKLSPGDYNPRIPDGSPEEINAILKAKTIAVVCEDFRQSQEMAARTKADVIFASAGGAAQPDSARRHSAADLLLTMHEANPKAKFVLTFHLKRCGGGAHYTENMGANSIDAIIAASGDSGEFDAMNGYARQLTDELLKRGMPRSAMTLQAVFLKPEHAHGRSHSIENVRTLSF